MTPEELEKLLYVARWRPLAEYGRERIKTGKAERPLSTCDNGRRKVEDRGLEPLTFWLPARRSPN